MSDAMEFQIADAVAAELNDVTRPWHTLFANENVLAKVSLAPWYTDASVLQTLKVAVLPPTIGNETEDRGGIGAFDYGILIDLQRQVDVADDARLRALSAAAEQIHDFFRDGHQLATLPLWTCLTAQRPDVYSLVQLRVENIWETLVSLSVRGYR